MIARAWAVLAAAAAALSLARDYNADHLVTPIDLRDLERRLRDLDRGAFPGPA
jgi:hypothetical protein